jgi:hypothetical protein
VVSNRAEDDGFSRAIKVCSTTSFGGEVKLLAQCRKILLQFKNSAEYERDIYSTNFAIISHQVSPD